MAIVIRKFDGAALFRALDERRTALGLTWRGAATEMWNLSHDLNHQRDDHSTNPSTRLNLGASSQTSCQHALFMLRWLQRSPESLPEGAVDDNPKDCRPDGDPRHRLRWSLIQLYNEMDAKRTREHVAWSSLAYRLGGTVNQRTGMKYATFATNMDRAMRVTQWLGTSACTFVYAATW
jgi:hypothetical protein